LDANACIISIAQHAKPKLIGQSELARAQFNRSSTLLTTKPSDCMFWSKKLFMLADDGHGTDDFWVVFVGLDGIHIYATWQRFPI